MELKSEFGHVRVELDESGNGARLMIQDMRTGKVAYFDPLELETLAWTRHEDLAPFLDPSFDRWKEEALSFGGLEKDLRP